MKVLWACLLLPATGICREAAPAVHATGINPSEGDPTFTIQNNYDGWVNPEDLHSMPQCIAQQDQAAWLSAMTKCTSKICTRHFWIICTKHQWLTQLSCLSTEFSPDVVQGYAQYCSRSVLANAQLYQWIRDITSRTWLVDVGDANELQDLSPASLAKGYASADVAFVAPTCLAESILASSRESFQHVLASCMFTSTTLHTGNAARPWEYDGSRGSIVALDFETVGYDLTGYDIVAGSYFDKACFCGTFTIDPMDEPCSNPAQVDFTKERMWMNATCGPSSLPSDWTDELKTTDFDYIPLDDWKWPACVADMPKMVTSLVDQCATDACERDPDGYCIVRHTVDRACFCRDIRYESCRGSCHIFETRIDYVKWLHGLCGNVQGWHGLPVTWRRLAAPSTLEMIPWDWTVKPNFASITGPGSTSPLPTCASSEWKLGSLFLVSFAPFLAMFLTSRKETRKFAHTYLWTPSSDNWLSTGMLIAASQILVNLFNAYLVQTALGYDDVPIFQLILLWCTMPRLAWLPVLLVGAASSKAKKVALLPSILFAESVIQLFSLYLITWTVGYGLQHGFYFHGLDGAERGTSARFMYLGAFLWLLTVITVSILWARSTLQAAQEASEGIHKAPKWQASTQIQVVGETTPMNGTGRGYTDYDTFSASKLDNESCDERPSTSIAATAATLFFLWIAQWMFWGGFIGLGSEVFCPPRLGILTTFWATVSLAGATWVAAS